MKVPETCRLLYQYSYYSMSESWGQLGISGSIVKNKFTAFICLLESCVLVAVYGLVSNIIFSHKIIIPDFLTPFPFIGLLVYAFALCHVNELMLGSERQIEHYKKIFDSWSKGKCLLWSFYTFLIATLLFAIVFAVVIEVDDYGLNPKNWKSAGSPGDYYNLYFLILFMIFIIIMSNFAKKLKPGESSQWIDTSEKITKRLLILGTVLILAPLILLLLDGVPFNELGRISQMLTSDKDAVSPLTCFLATVSFSSGIGILIWGGIRFLIFGVSAETN
jgi:hypothetical protein